MAIPVWGYVLGGVGLLVGVAIIANAVSQPAQLPYGPVQNPPLPAGVPPPVDAGAEAARGTFGLLTALTQTVGNTVERDRQRAADAAEATARRAEATAIRNEERARQH